MANLHPVETDPLNSPAVPSVAAPSKAKLITAIAFLLCLAVYLLRLDRVIGLFVDDAWYVLLAQSLATGQGYALPNSPTPGILPLYPPVFPVVLSLVQRLAPAFPGNVYWFKAISVIAMLIVGWLTKRYLERERGLPWMQALCLAVAVMLSPMIVFLATSSVMSECFFTLLFLATIVLVERSVKATGQRQLLLVAAAGSLAGLAMLTRSIGLALIVAGVLSLLKTRHLKAAILYGALAVMFAAPWMLYTRAHPPTLAEQKEQGGHIVLPYNQQFWQRRAGVNMFGTVTTRDLPARVINNLTEIAGRDVLRIVASPLFEWLRDPFAEAQQANVQAGGSGQPLLLSFALSLLVLLGYVVTARQRLTMAELAVLFSLGITVLWPWETIRFVLPLIPFLLLYFLAGARWLIERVVKDVAHQQTIALALCGLLVALDLVGHLTYLNKVFAASPLDRPQWVQIFDEAERMMLWLARETPRDTVIATGNSPLTYLYTGRKTVAADDPPANWENWKRLGVRYFVRAAAVPEPNDPADNAYRIVYRSRTLGNFRVLDLGLPSERGSWGAVAPIPELPPANSK